MVTEYDEELREAIAEQVVVMDKPPEEGMTEPHWALEVFDPELLESMVIARGSELDMISAQNFLVETLSKRMADFIENYLL